MMDTSKIAKLTRIANRRRVASTLLEVILVLPLLLILLCAVAQFGLFQSNQQSLEVASRAGGLVAAELPLNNTGPVPQDVLDAVTQTLRASRILGATENIEDVGSVRLDHNYNGPIPAIATLESGVVTCDRADVDFPRRRMVMVSVCIEATRLTPNCLAYFGVDFSNRFVSSFALYRIEDT